MKIFFDTEFYEDGSTIDLMSIGMVREDGRELYLINRDCDWRKPLNDPWHLANTLPHLSPIGSANWVPKKAIADLVLNFVGKYPEFWAYYADYDWVVLCQLYGRMIDLPKGWPMFCRDLQQILAEKHVHPKAQESGNHDALADAKWVRETYLEVVSR